MLRAFWNYLFSPSNQQESIPLQRPRKYPRTLESESAASPSHSRRETQQNFNTNPYNQFTPHYPPNVYPQQYIPPQFQFQFPFPTGYYGGLMPQLPYNPAGMQFNQSPNSFQLSPNPWAPNLPQMQPGIFRPPDYPPPGYQGPVLNAPIASAASSSIESPAVLQTQTVQHERLSTREDDFDPSTFDYPVGYARRECIKGQEPDKWNKTQWVWRSSGPAKHGIHDAELRKCVGVLRCASCGRLTRPLTQTPGREKQIRAGCTSRTCSIEQPLLEDLCDARAFHYKIQHGTSTTLVWEHYGDHASHQRPPRSGLSKFEQDQLDLQVQRRPGATVHALRTGDIVPGSVPLADISPCLANPKAARYAVGKSQARLGIVSQSVKGGLASISAIGDLQTRLPTPFIVASSLANPTHITLQTPFMDDIIRECVESWLLDPEQGPTATRHGFVIDGDLSFFQLGTLLATCAFSMTSYEWIPVLYSWINRQDTAHHRPIFAHLFKCVIKHAGSRFQRKLLLSVMDYSGAQRAAQAEEYADAIISISPNFSSLSPQAQLVERQQLVKEAEEAVVGCEVHFWRSADRISNTHSLVPPEMKHVFQEGVYELLSANTTTERFDQVVRDLKSTFPRTKNWFSWWERGPIAAMIFPVKRSVPPELVARVPSTTNPIEHQHSLLHHGVGKDQELAPGIEKLYLHVREMEKKSRAIKGQYGHFNASDPRNPRPPKPRAFQFNDGRAPDTIEALAAADGQQGADEIVVSNPKVDFPLICLKSYPWDAPNSCFFDNGMEMWYQAFLRWQIPEREQFLSQLPSVSALSCFFYHFQRRIRYLTNQKSTEAERERHLNQELGLGQAKARQFIFNRWMLYSDPASYGCATTWMHHAIRDSNTGDAVHSIFGVGHRLVGHCLANHRVIVRIGAFQTSFRLNVFDIRTARAKFGPEATLTDYFSTAIPRKDVGTDHSGTTVVHSMEISPCPHPECTHSSLLPIVDSIETEWPKILHLRPETSTLARFPLDKTFEISDEAGNLVQYQLIGTISFDAGRKHWTSKFLINDVTFSYDDTWNNGTLRSRGQGDLITIPDNTEVLWVFHRSSVHAKTMRSFKDTVSTYAEALDRENRRPKTPPIEIRDTPSPDNSFADFQTADDGEDVVMSELVGSGVFSPVFPLNLLPLEHSPPPPPVVGPEYPPPTDWCTECSKFCDPTAPVPLIRCAGCSFLTHVPCIVQEQFTTDVQWLCSRCTLILEPEPSWTDELLDTYAMFPGSSGKTFYPARIASVTSTGLVRVEWYKDNVYPSFDRPMESEFVVTKAECAKAAGANVDSNVGMIKWPYRLVEDAHDIHGYENPEISDALLHACQPILDIIKCNTEHPIQLDYEAWMDSAPINEEKRANGFAGRFNIGILPGDASLIEPHIQELTSTLFPFDPDSKTPHTMKSRRWFQTVGPILFQLVILRIYLRRHPSDDIQIYFLSRFFTSEELRALPLDDPLWNAKAGNIIRNITTPELVLNTPEHKQPGRSISYDFTKMKLRFTRAAEGRIPSTFDLASAFGGNGDEYVWQSSELPGLFEQFIDPPPSSPLTALSDIEVEPRPPSPAPLVERTKRRRAVEDIGGRESDSENKVGKKSKKVATRRSARVQVHLRHIYVLELNSLNHSARRVQYD
ncbi:hypothetical protein R3P38DRAFT_3423671 [Favolaschia claudopus]|uniref:Zinc finger PHD-type domain-containing protein n=1 Tax=Favolaschia claudopus TaxID=2862362 RepID=A0AAW0D7R9_9AGAR